MIDNKVRIKLIKGSRAKTLKIINPLFFRKVWEYDITNGLGYDLIRESQKKKGII